MSADLVDLYASVSVYLRTRSGSNDYGEPSWNTAVATTGVVQRTNRQVMTDKGEVYTARYVILLRTSETVSDGMQASVDGGTTYLDVIDIGYHRDATGELMHYEVVV